MNENMKGVFLLIIVGLIGIACGIAVIVIANPKFTKTNSNIGITIASDTLDYSQVRALNIEIVTSISNLEKNTTALQNILNTFNSKDSLNIKPVDQRKYEDLSNTIKEQTIYLNADIYRYNKTMNDTRFKYTLVDDPLPAYYEYR